MRLLYLSCHSVLEYDEITLFRELGIDVFSPGAYLRPAEIHEGMLRPPITDLVYDPHEVQLYLDLCHGAKDGKDQLSKELVDRFDAVLIMHTPDWVSGNWEAMKHKRVIWRTIGQSIPRQERQLARCRAQGLKIVRYSPYESRLENFLGSDALIRFYKDPDVYNGWTGENPVVCNFTQSMEERGEACGYDLCRKTVRDMPFEIYGTNNQAFGEQWKGCVDWQAQIEVMRKSRVLFYTGTHPASYTLSFMEAAMVGLPIVAIGQYWGNAPWLKRPDSVGGSDEGCLYEVPSFITQSLNGFYSDDVMELRRNLEYLLSNYEAAKQMSVQMRKKAIELFGKETIKQQWKAFLEKL